jgi:hypothetical protein
LKRQKPPVQPRRPPLGCLIWLCLQPVGTPARLPLVAASQSFAAVVVTVVAGCRHLCCRMAPARQVVLHAARSVPAGCPVITQDALVNQLPPLRLSPGWAGCVASGLCLGRLIRCRHFWHLASGCTTSGAGLALPPQYAAHSQRADEQQREDKHDYAAPSAPWFIVFIIVVELAIGLRVIACSPAAIPAGKSVIERIVKPGAQVIARLGWGRLRSGPAKRCRRTIAIVLEQIIVAVGRALIALCRRRRRARRRSGWRPVTGLTTRRVSSRWRHVRPWRRCISRDQADGTPVAVAHQGSQAAVAGMRVVKVAVPAVPAVVPEHPPGVVRRQVLPWPRRRYGRCRRCWRDRC